MVYVKNIESIDAQTCVCVLRDLNWSILIPKLYQNGQLNRMILYYC